MVQLNWTRFIALFFLASISIVNHAHAGSVESSSELPPMVSNLLTATDASADYRIDTAISNVFFMTVNFDKDASANCRKFDKVYDLYSGEGRWSAPGKEEQFTSVGSDISLLAIKLIASHGRNLNSSETCKMDVVITDSNHQNPQVRHLALTSENSAKPLWAFEFKPVSIAE